jgi:hypothetical protein
LVGVAVAFGDLVGVAVAFVLEVVGAGLPDAAATGADTVAVVIIRGAEMPPVDVAFPQPAAVPMIREAPIIMRVILRPLHPDRTPTPNVTIPP